MTKRKAVQQVEEAGNDYDNGGVQGPIDDKTDDFSNLTVPQLKYELELRGLRRSGRKAELLARLLEHAETCRQQEPQTKRARTQSQHPALTENNVIDLEDEDVTFDVAGFGGEQRLRPFVEAPDAKFKDKLKRIQKDRMFMLDRRRGLDRDGYLCETFDIAGSTGNVYQTTIGRSPNCVCMDARIRGQKCKHINYALIKILKAPPQLCYQQAFLSTELELIFANAPVTQAPVFEPHKHIEDDSLHNRKRKPLDVDCPICVCSMEEDEGIVWCKAACGQNFHADCIDQWKRSKNGGRVTCPYCRADWQDTDNLAAPPGTLAGLKAIAPKLGSYQNVAHLMSQYQELEKPHDKNDDLVGYEYDYD
ncbi:RING/U-box [Glarea lozoyensis ATCC 20868]|uniref:Postreplication repair E3 ubiquitin-protein ligase RAD18 n=1 Tax=Glarea lozoyensis (strain ATCC 20868 / MF5171) TaxID=1116229 RepID=S3DZX0_GLAL2|nr:RING/U-box [Glarea lozoyensis ATCC 20868]EPE31843.1 RING/U-box [Glarea lozoyensis ATCC 20868]